MKIDESNFFELLQKTSQYQIPIYQRNYAWTKKECSRLLDDLLKTGTPLNPNHYLGSVILKRETKSAIDTFNIIDGQQRTITISLLLLALKKHFLNNQNKFSTIDSNIKIVCENADGLYIKNELFAANDLFYKLLLKDGNDRKEYSDLVRGVSGAGLISKNYNYFLHEFASRNIHPDALYTGIKNSKIAIVTLDEKENPQLLFEAVNDTGLDLKEIDLIRNWIFMGLNHTEQDRLYRGYWQRLENMLSINNMLDDFLRYYTEIHAGIIIGNHYYATFKKKFITKISNSSSVENLLRDILEYAKLYSDYYNGAVKDAKLSEQLCYLKHTDQYVFTPLILKILRLINDGCISNANGLVMLKYLESYIVRRDMILIPTNSLGRAMIELLNNCSTVEDFKKCLLSLNRSKSMPTDNTLENYLSSQPFYGNKNAYYYLERLEKSYNSSFSLSTPTIEHIMPETIHTNSQPITGVSNPDDFNWEEDLGQNVYKIHETYKHTIGNLTILPREINSRMANYRFKFKKDLPALTTIGSINYGYNQTPIFLSQDLKNYQVWDEKAILERANKLIKKICEIWPYPSLGE